MAFLKKNVDKITWSPEVKTATQELIDNFGSKRTSWKAADKLRIALGLKIFKVGEKNDDILCGSLKEEELKMTAEEQQEFQKL